MDPTTKSEMPGGGFGLMEVLVLADLYNTQVRLFAQTLYEYSLLNLLHKYRLSTRRPSRSSATVYAGCKVGSSSGIGMFVKTTESSIFLKCPLELGMPGKKGCKQGGIHWM